LLKPQFGANSMLSESRFCLAAVVLSSACKTATKPPFPLLTQALINATFGCDNENETGLKV
jgi:hypothetical protein